MTKERDIVGIARRWIGTPYRHQCSMEGFGADCLGLIRGIWREVIGTEPESMPAYTPDWGEMSSQELLHAAASRWLVPKDLGDQKDGDVILLRMRQGGPAKHMAVCASSNGMPTMIHAYTGHGVVETSLSLPWHRKITGRFEFPEGVV